MATAEQALEWVENLYQRLMDRRPAIEKAFRYFDGDQPLSYASDHWKKFHEDRYRNFADNWCGIVGHSPVDRLRIDGFRLGSKADRLTSEEQQLWADWNRNDLEAQSSQGFLASTIAKRSFVLVWGNENDEPVVSWEHPEQVVVDYAPGTRIRRAALKAWIDGRTEYATLYLADGVYKFERPTWLTEEERNRLRDRDFTLPSSLSAGGWKVREVDGESWPLPNPLGEVSIVEWPNRPQLNGEPLSDIAGTMAMQDAINVLWAYLFNAADHASMAARVVTGAEPPKVPVLDNSGQIVGSQPAKLEDLENGRLLFLPGKKEGANPSIDQWDAAKLDVFTDVITQAVTHIAAQTQTPGHYLIASENYANLNGDALTAAEVPLSTKVVNAQISGYNPAAKETARLMAKVRGNDRMADVIAETNGRKFVHWKNPAMHSLSQVGDAASKARSNGMSLHTVLEEFYGMSEPEIEREKRRIREEQASALASLDPATLSAMNGETSADSDAPAGS